MDFVADSEAERHGHAFADESAVAYECAFSVEEGVIGSGDGFLEFEVDTADLNGANHADLRGEQDGALNERSGSADGGVVMEFFCSGFPVMKHALGGVDGEVRIEAKNFAAEFVIESGHDGDDENEHGDAEGDSEDGDHADDGDERPFWSEVPEGEEERDGEAHGIRRGGCGVERGSEGLRRGELRWPRTREQRILGSRMI